MIYGVPVRPYLAAAITLAFSAPVLAAVPPVSAAPTSVPVSLSAAAAADSSNRPVAYTQWDGGRQFRQGSFAKTRVMKGRLVLGAGKKAPTYQRRYSGRSYDQGKWTSPWVTPDFGLTELIPSWDAKTPGDTWIEVRVRARTASGGVGSWDVMGRWASDDRWINRRTKSGQADDLGRANVDTWQTTSGTAVAAYQVRVQLMRKPGTKNTPSIDVIGAAASRLTGGEPTTSRPGSAAGTVLDNAPRYSQMIHTGHYPQWGAGGQAWCSPTSTSMVLGYYNALPPAKEYGFVPGGHQDPWVDSGARATFDYDYDGTGNWAFNTAYAATLTKKAFVTRLRNLREVEDFIQVGIPIVASLSWKRGDLTNAAVGASNGHLMVIVGFTSAGDVIVNDPAASSASGVRRTYDRAEFERAWLTTSSRGTSYVIRDGAHPLPASRGNW